MHTPQTQTGWVCPRKALFILFAINIASVFLHYVDNVTRLEVYPDLPTTKPSTIALFGAVMVAIGLLGVLMYVSDKLRTYSFYFLYIYYAMNVVVLGHYLPSRLPGSFLDVDPTVHFTILFEAATALVMCAYTVLLHYRCLRERNPATHPVPQRPIIDSTGIAGSVL